jgi:hypothetical protein
LPAGRCDLRKPFWIDRRVVAYIDR